MCLNSDSLPYFVLKIVLLVEIHGKAAFHMRCPMWYFREMLILYLFVNIQQYYVIHFSRKYIFSIPVTSVMSLLHLVSSWITIYSFPHSFPTLFFVHAHTHAHTCTLLPVVKNKTFHFCVLQNGL